MTGDNGDIIPLWAQEVLTFWFEELGQKGWWAKSDIIDKAITEHFLEHWEKQRLSHAEAFLGRGDEALAAIILFDQFPRNMFRGDAKAYATDGLARDIAHGALARGYDIQAGEGRRAFFYMPFQHSEDLEEQRLSLKLFEDLGEPVALDFARKHHDMIAQFGRFPHRNAALGRENLPGEEQAIEQGKYW